MNDLPSDCTKPTLGDYLIVECKNRNEKADAAVIREFAGRLRTAKVKSGVLVSMKGITGTGKRGSGTGARPTIWQEYLTDSTAILILDETHITNVVAGKIRLSTHLLEQFENVRFDIRLPLR